ncbi:MAG: glycosyltransferase [bacterium]
MKILFIADDFSEGGAASVCHSLINALASDEIQPVAASLDGIGCLGEQLKKQGIPFYFLDRKPGLDYSLFFRIREIIRKERIEIVHLHQYTSFFYGSIGSLLAGNRRIIFTEHGREVPDLVRPKRVIVNKLVVPFIKEVIAVSQSVKKSLTELEKIPAERIRVLLNGIDTTPLDRKFDSIAKRKELGISEEAPVAAIVARLCDYKNHAKLFEAWKTVTEQLPEAVLLVIGGGPMESELKRLSESIPGIAFTGVRHDVPELLAAVDIVTLCSFYEGTSITLLEAMAAAKAVVASRVAGNLEVVKEGETGLLVSPENPGEIASALLRLLKDRRLSIQMGQAGKKRQQELYSLEEMVSSYRKLYFSAAGNL